MKNDGFLLALLALGGIYLMTRTRMALPVTTNVGSMPGNVGTGIAQQVGGMLGGLLHSLNGSTVNASGNPFTNSNITNLQNSSPQAGTVQDQQVANDVASNLLNSLGFAGP